MPSPLAQHIGQRVYAARVAAGLRQSDVAREARVTDSYISRLERGLVAHPRVIDLRRVARALETTFEALIADDASDGPATLHAVLLDATGDPRLSSQLMSLAQHWGLFSASERLRLYAAIEHALASIQTASGDDGQDHPP